MLQGHSVRELLAQAHVRFGDRPFIIDQTVGTVSYSDVLHFARGLERQLDELGIPVGGSVAMLFHNCAMAVLCFLGIMASRRVLVPLNPISTASELEYMLRRSKCAAVIVDPSHTLARNYGTEKAILVGDHHLYFLERRRAGAETAFRFTDAGPADVFVGEIVFTSGSTGRPKGVVLAERSLIANASALAVVYDLRDTDRFLTVCPLFHNSGQVFTTLSCLLVGGATVAVKSSAGMLHFWSYMDQYRANWSFGMVSFLALLLSRQEGPREPGVVRGLLTGGSAIDASMIERFESRFRVPVRTVYGLTETASISTCEYLDPHPRSFGSSGRPLPICKVRIGTAFEADGVSDSPSPPQSGEIWISGDNVFESYIGDPDLTRERKVGGWVRTGDVGFFDSVGNLFVVDRADSMLIVGGENVYPAEVENLCASLPGAAEIVLAGVDHSIWGKELVLLYKAEADRIPSIRSWRRILGEQIAAVKVPQRYVSIHDLGLDDFPRKDNGKLDRPAIAALLSRLAPNASAT